MMPHVCWLRGLPPTVADSGPAPYGFFSRMSSYGAAK
jgi:hypothetical protein